MNRKALLVAVVSAALGVALLFVYKLRFEAEVTGGRMVPVLVAAQRIGLNEPLTEANLGFRNVPEAYVEERHIRRADLRRVIGVRVSMEIPANQAVLWTDLVTVSEGRRDLSSMVRPGMRAVTIRADGTSTFGGLIRPGDRVDVMATISRGAREEDRVTVPVIQNLLVLAAGRDMGGEAAAARASASGSGGAGANSQPTTHNDIASQVTLLTSLDEAALLILAQERGRLSLVLRNADDIAVIEGQPETTINDIIQSRGRVHAQPAPAGAPQRPREIEVIRGNNAAAPY